MAQADRRVLMAATSCVNETNIVVVTKNNGRMRFVIKN